MLIPLTSATRQQRSKPLKAFAEFNNGRLDAVFASAGVLFMGPNEDITRAQKKLQVDVNVIRRHQHH